MRIEMRPKSARQAVRRNGAAADLALGYSGKAREGILECAAVKSE